MKHVYPYRSFNNFNMSILEMKMAILIIALIVLLWIRFKPKYHIPKRVSQYRQTTCVKGKHLL